MTPTPNSTPKRLFLPVLLAIVFLSGCEIREEDWTRMPQPRTPKVEQASFTHSVVFAPDEAVLAPERRTELDRFLIRTRTGSADSVRVVSGPGGAAIASRRAASVTAYLRHLGALVEVAAAGFGLPTPEPDTVDVIVRRSVVVLPGCPDWSDKPGDTRNNTVSRNWGCATAVNLGLMVAEPRDLVAGRDLSPADGDAAVLGIQRYRAGETKPLAPEDVGTIESQQRQDTGGGN